MFVAPFAVDSTGAPIPAEPDSIEDISASIYNLVVCQQGGKLGDPDFGIASPLFETFPVALSPIVNQITKYEPRVTDLDLEQVMDIVSAVGTVDISIGASAVTEDVVDTAPPSVVLGSESGELDGGDADSPGSLDIEGGDAYSPFA